MSQVVKPLNIDNILGKPKNRVSLIGVELEGGWKPVPPGVAIELDNSVFKGNRAGGISYGEIPIGPIQPAALPKFMKKYYPHLIDKSCGMHVHMSFATLVHYGWLMDTPAYQETMIAYLYRWAKAEGFPPDHYIWPRFEDYTYCQKKFWPDEQVKVTRKDYDRDRKGHRYTAVNYCGRQLTIEVRLLPMMTDVGQAIRAVRHVIDITNACLVVLSNKEGKVGAKLEMGQEWEDVEDMEVRL